MKTMLRMTRRMANIFPPYDVSSTYAARAFWTKYS
jgi:hypothetical protein